MPCGCLDWLIHPFGPPFVQAAWWQDCRVSNPRAKLAWYSVCIYPVKPVGSQCFSSRQEEDPRVVREGM